MDIPIVYRAIMPLKLIRTQPPRSSLALVWATDPVRLRSCFDDKYLVEHRTNDSRATDLNRQIAIISIEPFMSSNRHDGSTTKGQHRYTDLQHTLTAQATCVTAYGRKACLLGS